MKANIRKLYSFLKKNRKYNRALQNKNIEELFSNVTGSKSKKTLYLLHYIFYTQSQAKLDKAQEFFEGVWNNKRALNSLKSFCKYLGHYNPDQPYLSIYTGLKNQGGWGEKTSALFVKHVYLIHQNKKKDTLKFWDDAPKLSKKDTHYLPVDAVILDIFTRFDNALNSFKRINNYLADFKDKDVWDDLWFWGFISQTGSKSPRKLGFNKSKYWLLLHTDKTPKKIKEIEGKCREFVSLIPKA